MHYHFTAHDNFERDITQGKFLEYAHVHKNIYGTSEQAVQDVADSGRCCVLDSDVQGARQVGAGCGGWCSWANEERVGSRSGCGLHALWSALA